MLKNLYHFCLLNSSYQHRCNTKTPQHIQMLFQIITKGRITAHNKVLLNILISTHLCRIKHKSVTTATNNSNVKEMNQNGASPSHQKALWTLKKNAIYRQTYVFNRYMARQAGLTCAKWEHCVNCKYTQKLHLSEMLFFYCCQLI